MKALKIAGIISLGLVLTFLIVAAAIPKEYQVARSTTIRATPDLVFAEVANFSNWEKWNPWKEVEPNYQRNVSGPTASPGHKLEWKGEKVGIGSLTIEFLQVNESIIAKLDIQEPQEMVAEDEWKFEKTESGTKVTWINRGTLKYPMGRIFGLFIDRFLGADYERGLKNLKEVVEET